MRACVSGDDPAGLGRRAADLGLTDGCADDLPSFQARACLRAQTRLQNHVQAHINILNGASVLAAVWEDYDRRSESENLFQTEAVRAVCASLRVMRSH